MRRKVGKGERPALQVGEAIELAVEMAVGGEHIFHFETPAIGIALGLLHALEGIFRFFLGFEYAYGQGLRHVAHLHAEQVINAAGTLAPASLWAGRLDRGGRFHPDPLVRVVSLVP